MSQRDRAARRALLLGAVILASLAARAAAADPDDDGSDWTAFQAPAATGTVLAPDTAEGGFSAPDRQSFDAKLRSKVLDQLCRQLKVNQDIGVGLPGDFSGTRLGLARYLATYPDNSLAVVDEERLNASFVHGFARELGGDASLTGGLSLSASITGTSMVVRRLDSKQSCDEVGRLANFTDIKTAVPMTAKRIAAMQLGELWRVPMTLTYGQGLSLSDILNNDGSGHIGSASITFGRSDAGTASMTLYRIADDQVRFRFRIDHVVIYNRGAGIYQTIPAIAFATDAHNILLRYFQKQIANQLDRYTSLWLTYGRSSSDGAKVLMEFVLDPRDPAQAEALARAARGDFAELVRMAVRMSTLHAGDADTLKDYERLRQDHAKQLGDPTYAASDNYRAKTHSFSFNLPLFIQHNATSLFGADAVTRYTGPGGRFRFYRADKSKSNEYFTLPWVGPMVKDNSQRDVETVTYAPPGSGPGEPIMVYIRNEGYLREPASTVRGNIEEMNGVLALAGAQRGATARARLQLPEDSIAPPAPKREADYGGEEPPAEPSDRKGWMSFTLVFNQKAVSDIVSASADQILKAFALAADRYDRPMADWLLAHGTFRGGKLEYDWRAARRAFPDEEDGAGAGSSRELENLARQAAAVVADVWSARDAKIPTARARRLAEIVGGKGRSGLAYEDILRVLVQLADPMDLTGDFVSNMKSTAKGVKDLNAHLVLKKGRAEVPMLRDAGATKSRFAEPSILTD